jgi:hypothetical protein
VRLVARCQSYGDGAWGMDHAAMAFAYSMDRLRNLRPVREVGTDDDVVDQIRVGVAFASRPGVNGSCRDLNQVCRSWQGGSFRDEAWR